MSSRDQNVRQVLQRTLHLLELSRDIERNRSDGEFAAEGGQIDYVFDENIFELFIDPKRMRGMAATFYNPSAPAASQTRAERFTREFASQAALICSEYLFSGQLPGQREGAIFISPWHRAELAFRVERILDGLRDRKPRRDSLADLFWLSDNIQDGQLPRGGGAGHRLRSILGRNTFLQHDLESLQERGGPSGGELSRFAAARVGARSLALDSQMEPVEQINRVVSPDGVSRSLSSLSKLDRRPDADEQRLISLEAEGWFRRLKQESWLRHGREARSDGALWADARTLALLRWTSRNTNSAQRRIVLVTGDTILFDAYRRWYAEQSLANDGWSEPFCLRRPVQYTPILNVTDVKADFQDVNNLFRHLEQAVEISLLPFNLSTMSNEVGDPMRAGREHLALRLSNAADPMREPALKMFVDRLTDDWFQAHSDRLMEVFDHLQAAERTVVGGMFPLISNRITDRQQSRIRHMSGLPQASKSEAAAAYMQELLLQADRHTLGIWAPLAIDFVADQAIGVRSHSGRPRAPITVRLPIGESGEAGGHADLIERLLSGELAARTLLEESQELLSDHTIAFTLAATLALAVSDWRSARRFSELAKRSVKSAVGVSSETMAEVDFLYAQARRFHIGDRGVSRRQGAAEAAWRDHEEAEAALDRCLEFYASDPTAEGCTRLLRVVSEKAALKLFVAASVGLAAQYVEKTYVVDIEGGRQALLDAARALIHCFDHEAELAARSDVDQAFLTKVSTQFVTNSAAFSLVSRLYPDASEVPAFLTRFHEFGDSRVAELADSNELPDFRILRIELDHFLGRSWKISSRDDVVSSRAEMALDRALAAFALSLP